MFPNASKGAGKLFAAELLQLFAFVFGLMGAFSIFVAIQASNNDGDFLQVGGMGLIAYLLAGLGVILAIVALVLKLVGLWQASRDERGLLRAAFIVLVIEVALPIALAAAGAAGLIAAPDDVFSSARGLKWTTMLVEVPGLVVTILSVLGLNKLVRATGRRGVAVLGIVALVFYVLAAAGAAGAVLMLTSVRWIAAVALQASSGTGLLVALGSSALLIVGFILYVIYLAKAKMAFVTTPAPYFG